MRGKGALSEVGSGSIQSEEDEYLPLSGKPYFDIVLSKTHVNPGGQLYLSSKLLPDVPPGPCRIPAVLTCRHKSWNVSYYATSSRHALTSGWKAFVVDNDLKVGDACIFELLECSTSEIKFRVQILRGDFPSELLRAEDDRGFISQLNEILLRIKPFSSVEIDIDVYTYQMLFGHADAYIYKMTSISKY